MRRFILLLTVIMTSRSLYAQSSVSGMVQTSLTRIKASSQAGRVVERTFSDIIFKDDSTGTNLIFFHRFSSCNSYRINAFAPSASVSAINAYVYFKDNNGKWQKMANNTTTGSDVSFRFSPQTTGSYAIMIRGTLQANINNALFNLIIERE